MRVPFAGIFKNPGCLINIKPKVCGQMSNSSCSVNSSTTATRKSNNQIILSSNQMRPYVMRSRSLNPVYPPFVFLGDGGPQKHFWWQTAYVSFHRSFSSLWRTDRPHCLDLHNCPCFSFLFLFLFPCFCTKQGRCVLVGGKEGFEGSASLHWGAVRWKKVLCMCLVCLLMCSVCTENNRLLGLKVWAAEWVTDCDISVYTRLLASD